MMSNLVRSALLGTVFLLSTFTTNVNAESVTSKEYQAVIDTALNYFNGAANGDQELLRGAFDVEFGDIKMPRIDKKSGKEVIRTVPLDEFAGYFKAATQDKWQAKILSVDIVDDKMAMVKLDFDTPKTHYIDYLVMYKRNSQWRIVNKTFVATSK
jgi:hypothetical protein